MSSPDVPLRLSFSVEVPGTPEQVWEAIATGPGISSWFLPTDVEEREGGAYITHMGETDSPGTVTEWAPPRRFAYEEPDWAALAGHEGAAVTPLRSEFLVEARSGGTCVVTVVSSAFGTGADWEQEFLESMEQMWVPFFDNLRFYLTHFPGQHATTLSVEGSFDAPAPAVLAAMRDAIGATAAGKPFDLHGLTGEVEQLSDVRVLVRLADPLPGLLQLWSAPGGDSNAVGGVGGWIFADRAPAYVERNQAAWKAWLDSLV
jgi:uncharacterized protein YndB with AHSA1/START domain